jgi:hypothetical protein
MSARGQSTLEYAVFITVVAAAVVSMSLYVRRGIMANLKLLECQINAEALSSTGGVGCETE